ncbi:prominin, partial [Loa loa]
ILTNITTAQTTKDAIQSVFLFWMKQFWAHLSLTIALVFIFLLPISGLFFFCNQCCCNYGNTKRNDTNSFEIIPCCYLVLLIGLQAVMIGSLMISLESVDHTFNNTKNINKFVRNISKDTINVIKIIFDDVKCEMHMTLDMTFNKIRHLLWQLPSNTFNYYKETDGYINMQMVINDMKNISWTLNKTTTSLQKSICDIRSLPIILQKKLENLTTLIDDIISYAYQINVKNIMEEGNGLMDDAKKETMKLIGIIYNGSVDIIKFIQKNYEQMDNIHKQYIE